jgi:Putative restriction endonuclease
MIRAWCKDTNGFYAHAHPRQCGTRAAIRTDAQVFATQVGLVHNTDKRDRSMAEARARSAETLARWAEIVPHTGLMTEEELLALPEDGWQYELVEGRLVRMTPSGLRATQIAFIIGAALFAFVQPRKLGAVTGADGGYRLAPGTTSRQTWASSAPTACHHVARPTTIGSSPERLIWRSRSPHPRSVGRP